MRRVVAEMKDALDRVFVFLRDVGLQIDDHYHMFMNAVEEETRRALTTDATRAS